MEPRESQGASESHGSRQLSRRQFLTRSAALGISIPLAGELFAAYTSSPSAAAASTSAAKSSSNSSSKGITVGLDTDIDTLDPISFRSDAAYEAVIQVYDMPVNNPVKRIDGILQGVAGSLVPELAVKYSVSPDETVYKFTVRKGVKFSNGYPVTADAFRYSYLRALEGPGYASLVMGLLKVTKPSQIVATGPMTFELRLSEPNPLGPKLVPLSVLEIMDPKLSKHEATKKDPWAADYYRTHMMGTGPYMQSSTTWQSGNQYLLEKNPHYWDRSKVKNGGVLLKYVPSADDRALLVQEGSIDVAFGLPANKLHSLRHAHGLRLINVPSRNWNYLGMNNTIKPFNDVRVRQAIAYALPYESLIKDSLYGFASPLKGIIASSTPTADDSLWPYKTDVRKANHLMAEAGHSSGFNTTLTVQVSTPDDLNSATFIQAALHKIGIDITISQVSSASFATKVDSGEVPMFIDYWYSWVDDPFYQMYWLLDSKNTETGGSNTAKYSDAEMDKLINSGVYDTNARTREQRSRAVQTRFNEAVPYVPLYSENFTLATRTDVKGVNVFPDQYVRFWMLYKD
ncbi:MAG: ABC transporter substrate-binding protein [Acidimicrobiales bacterium]